MLTLALATPLVLLHRAPSDDIEAALEALIERTNELSGFSARYSLESSDGGTGALAFDFAAPDLARLDIEGAMFGGRVTTWASAEEMCMLGGGDGEGTTYARVALPDVGTSALAVVDELFPSPDEDALGPGPSFSFHLAFDEETDRVDIDLSLMAFGSRSALLSWLPAWRAEPELLELTEGALVLTHARFGATIPLATGFLSEAWLIGKDGREHRFRLTSLELDESADEARFEIPERPAGAQDDSARMQAGFTGLNAARGFRGACLARIDAALAAGRVEWKEAVREDARAVFRALHEPWVTELGEQATASFAEWVESYADWLEEQLGAGRSKAELRELAAQSWSELEAKSATALEGWQEALAADPLPTEGSRHHDEFLALEAEVFATLYAQHVRAPARRAFDEATSAVLDGGEARAGS